ncbi:SRPBCC domain-containing protein [Blastopirellula sp. J2-11]|uniref:SRPBCC domain-containing protein n=1 Tax=Blastopirellula sp. J2-11 TaxID=2943192 RepID=UPI0021CA3272|nr:SRPBCC domain-containing protein [Blastopirellula sp. J2-11]UUO07683.1 SRPBCC domain-containing protein [Blastopirellula sp. J2-11]
MNQHDVDSIPADRKIEATRLVPFAPTEVFQAFRAPSSLERWWGPDGFTNTFHEFDFRPGGDWKFLMHGPDGTDYPNESRFVEIIEPTRIVFDHLAAPKFQTILALAPVEEGCRIDWCMVFEDAKTRADVCSYSGDGLEQNLNRLVATLSE